MDILSKKNIGGGLLPLKKDPRDFKLSKVLGAIDLSTLPEELNLAPDLKVKDQGSSDYCTGYVVSSASELQEGVELSPHYQFAKTRQIIGNIDGWGASLRDACKSAVKFGSLEESEVREMYQSDFRKARDWSNWSIEQDLSARKHRKRSYFRVDGYENTFDAIKAALWMKKAVYSVLEAVLAGVLWRSYWTSVEMGVIPNVPRDDNGFGHAILFVGWKFIKGKEHLIAHLSNGEGIGEKGIFYFPREVVEKEFGKYGLYQLQDMSPEDYKKNHWGFWEKMYDFFYKLKGIFRA